MHVYTLTHPSLANAFFPLDDGSRALQYEQKILIVGPRVLTRPF